MASLTLVKKKSAKNEYLTEAEAVELELPNHLYLVALNTNRFGMANWTSLSLYFATTVQLAALNDDSDVLDLMKHCMSVMTVLMLNNETTGLWGASERQYAALSEAVTVAGDYCRQFTMAQITKATLAGANDLRGALDSLTKIAAHH